MQTAQCDVCNRDNVKSGNVIGSNNPHFGLNSGIRLMSLRDHKDGHKMDICEVCEQRITDLIVLLYHGSE